jgi:GT2 family glycosyltransferase
LLSFVSVKEKWSYHKNTRNLGAKNASGKYLLFIDADTTIPRDAIENIYSMLKGRDRVVICGRYSKEPLNKGFFQKYYCLFKYFVHKDYFENAVTVLTWFFILKKEYFEEAGGFSKIKGDYEAEEFGRRLAESYNIIYTPDIEINHNWAGFFKLHKIYLGLMQFAWKMRHGILRKSISLSSPFVS